MCGAIFCLFLIKRSMAFNVFVLMTMGINADPHFQNGAALFIFIMEKKINADRHYSFWDGHEKVTES